MTIFKRILKRLSRTPDINPNHHTSITQKRIILAHLQGGATLTGLDALRLCGCIKCSNRISELRAEGHDIKDRWIYVIDSHGQKKHVKEYYIETNPAQA